MPYIKNMDGVQHPDWRFFSISLAAFVANDNVVEIELPPGSQVIDGFINKTTAFNTTGTDTIKIGDSVDDDRYLAATTLKTVALTAITPTGFLHGYAGSPSKLRITRTPADTAATAGEVIIAVATLALGKSYHTQG